MNSINALVLAALLGICGLATGNDCARGEFECDNGNCIYESWVCDGRNDCGDWSDEPDDCGPCSGGEIQCANGRCLTADYICDGDNDCGDNSDEIDPTTGQCPLCPGSHFQCNNGRCTRFFYTCDGYNDCLDWTDEGEEVCPCGDNKFRCPNPPSTPPGACIPGEFVCDEGGIWDCPDGADEKNCTVRVAGI